MPDLVVKFCNTFGIDFYDIYLIAKGNICNCDFYVDKCETSYISGEMLSDGELNRGANVRSLAGSAPRREDSSACKS